MSASPLLTKTPEVQVALTSEQSLNLDKYRKDNFPLPPKVALEFYRDVLNSVEQKEILKYEEIYYVNKYADGSDDFLAQGKENWGFDDDKNYYRFRTNDQIAFRF